MVDKSNVPEIRFAGFTDPWEQRKLGELTTILSAARVHKEEWRTAGVPFYRSSDVMAAFNGTENERVFISQELFERLSAQTGAPQKGDVMVTGGGSVGTPYIVPDNRPFYTKDADLIWIKRHAEIDPKFLYSFFVSPIFKLYIRSISHVGTIAHYTIEQVKETPLLMPCSIVEQKAIGSFLGDVDNLITLHQRKYEKLIQLKKSMLDKMFPKPGETEPEIRFAGFTDPWEQRKLGELFSESSERSSSMEILSVSVAKGIYPASESDRDTNPGASLVNYKVVHKGDIVYNSMRMWQGAVGSSDFDGIVSPAYVVARPTIELDSTCFGYLLKRPEMLYKYLCDSQGNSKDTQTLKYDRFADIEVAMPANLEEQRAISACLGSVDHLITLHQRKYEKLIQLKKSMLDKMFPKPGETEPEIRFAGFTDPWEQRKLGELFSESSERSSSMEILSVSVAKGIYPASESDRDTNPGASLVNYKVVHKGDIVYNSMRMWQGAVGSSDFDGIVSPAYVVARPTIELDSTCFGYLLKRPEMLYKYLCDSQGNSKDTQTLKYDRFADIEVAMPANLEEQRAISACLGSVDHLITLHQRKLELLRNTKKSLLDRMFV